jgi:predicted metal-binding membrane protein
VTAPQIAAACIQPWVAASLCALTIQVVLVWSAAENETTTPAAGRIVGAFDLRTAGSPGAGRAPGAPT